MSEDILDDLEAIEEGQEEQERGRTENEKRHALNRWISGGDDE